MIDHLMPYQHIKSINLIYLYHSYLKRSIPTRDFDMFAVSTHIFIYPSLTLFFRR
ncbi:hypothetical protein HanIR_Chr11g0521001 [Helianthus annuus]|nr:hypothetical protein HanIR_Chr11g0521001 [Helianthus annuus]